MKKYLLTTTLLLTFVGQLFAQDREAIIEVITLETAAYNGKNYEQWKSCWHTEGEILFNYITKQNMYLIDNWKELDRSMKPSFKEEPNLDAQEIIRTNIRMNIGDNVAWANYNQDDNGRITKEQRVLVKVGDEWKIVNMTAVHVTSFGMELAGGDD